MPNACFKVKLTVHGCADLQGSVGKVRNDTVLFLNVQYLCATKRTAVRTLTALFREKRGPIQHYGKSGLLLLASEHRGVKRLHVAVLIK